MSAVSTDDSRPAKKLPSNAVADRLIANGRRPLVLGAVVIEAVEAVPSALFDVLAHVSDGADGIDLTLPPLLTPADQLVVADQLAEATGTSFYLRADVPMAAGQHSLILSGSAGRLRRGANVMYDIGFDQSSPEGAIDVRPAVDDDRSLSVSTVGFAALSDGALMGLVSAAAVRGIAAVSSDRTRIVRRVVDTLAPLHPNVPKGEWSHVADIDQG